MCCLKIAVFGCCLTIAVSLSVVRCPSFVVCCLLFGVCCFSYVV